ncbi:MAG: hypothetical protein Q4F43_05455 [Eubacteriales bacterium]|nr:hypothetical protein [Eubacteriales bacterium]
MKNIKKWITSPVATVALFVLAAGLLLFSTIGGARAAFIAISETYQGHIEMYDIGVSLLESCEKGGVREVARRNHIKNSEDEWDEASLSLVAPEHFLGETGEFIPGKVYKEELSVANTGNIDEYVRVTVYKYWRDPSGEKVLNTDDAKTATVNGFTQNLSPALIDLHLTNTNSWLLDEKATTEERIVVYYNKVLPAGEDLSETPLSDTLTVDKRVADKVTQTISEDKKTITTTYDYDGWQFCLEAEVDAVQNRNAKDAIKSAWGRDVNISEDGTLSLVN